MQDQDRGMTVNDYKVKVEEIYSNASSVSVQMVKIMTHFFMVVFILQSKQDIRFYINRYN